MKKFLCLLISFIITASVFTAVPLSSSAATKKVSLKKTSATLKISKKNGKNVYGSTTIEVKKAKGVKITKKSFKSSNNKIAKVSSKGKVVAKKKGNAKIAVTVKYKIKKKSYTKKLIFKVNVKDVRKKASVPVKPTEPSKATSEEAPSQSEAAQTSEQAPSQSEAAQTSEQAPSQSEAAQTSENNAAETDTSEATASETTTSEATASEATVSEVATSEEAPATSEEAQTSEAAQSEAAATSESSAPATSESIPKENDPIDDDLSELNEVEIYNNETFLKNLSDFSNRLYEMSAKDENGNYTMSPMSVYMALSMLHSIGDNTIKNEIEDFVGMSDRDMARTGELFDYLSKTYKNWQDEIVSDLILTNSIWLDNSAETDKDTLDALVSNYRCGVYNTPFQTDNQTANDAVRDYVKENTKGLIDKDFKLNDQTIFALINTLYFKDIWSMEIENLPTEQKDFNLTNGSVNCEFIKGSYFDGQVQETDCCYYFYTKTSCGYKMKFILPKAGHTLKEAMSAENLNKINLDNDYDVIDTQKVHHLTRCIFPSFKVSSDTPLKDIFKNNNLLTNAFNTFYSPLITNEPNLMVSDIKHSTIVDVSKEGIEGAAVTIIGVAPGSAYDPEEKEYHTFTLDSEFGFLITNTNNIVLFEGQVTNPGE